MRLEGHDFGDLYVAKRELDRLLQHDVGSGGAEDSGTRAHRA